MHRSHFGAAIKKLRLDRQLTQEQLASLADLERTFVSMLERGVKQPSLKTISNLSRAFGLRNHQLLHFVEEEMHASTPSQNDSAQALLDQQKIQALELEQENHRIQEIVNAVPVIFFSRNPDTNHTTTFISHNISQLTGYSKNSFIDTPMFWHDHIHPDDRPGILQQLGNLCAGQLRSLRYRFAAANGAWLEIREELRLTEIDEGHTSREILGTMSGEANTSIDGSAVQVFLKP